MGNGYKGVTPELTGRQKLYLEATGMPISSEAYRNLCNWYVGIAGEPRGKVECLEMQQAMLERVFPNMLSEAELSEHLRQVFADDKPIWAELIIRRYGLDQVNGFSRKVTALAPELAREYGYTENTVRAMMGKAMNSLCADEYFRGGVLQVPELSDSLLNYWQFVYVLLARRAQWQEQTSWSEEVALQLADRLREINVNNLGVLGEVVEIWLSTMPEEVQLATRLRYGLGYPMLGRSDDYITVASGFDMERNLMNFLRTKVNRVVLSLLLSIDMIETEDYYWQQSIGWDRSIKRLGLPRKAAEVLEAAGVPTLEVFLWQDMLSEKEEPWRQQVPSKYWPEVVQAWTDLRINTEVDEYEFDETAGCYLFQKVS